MTVSADIPPHQSLARALDCLYYFGSLGDRMAVKLTQRPKAAAAASGAVATVEPPKTSDDDWGVNSPRRRAASP